MRSLNYLEPMRYCRMDGWLKTDTELFIRFYFPYILQSAGVTGTYLALLGNGIGGLVNFVATLFVMIYVSFNLLVT